MRVARRGDTFSFDVSDGGPTDVVFGAQAPGIVALAAGSYDVSEDATTGYEQLGWSLVASSTAPCPAQPQHPAGAATVTVSGDATTALCFYNQPVAATAATIIVQKVYQAKNYTPQPQDEPVVTIGGQAPDSHIGSPATQWQKAVTVAANGTNINVQEPCSTGWAVVAGFVNSCTAVAGDPTTSVTLTSVKPGRNAITSASSTGRWRASRW